MCYASGFKLLGVRIRSDRAKYGTEEKSFSAYFESQKESFRKNMKL